MLSKSTKNIKERTMAARSDPETRPQQHVTQDHRTPIKASEDSRRCHRKTATAALPGGIQMADYRQ